MARLLVNPRSRVLFAGFSSDTYTLGRHGWDVSVKEEFDRRRFEMMLSHAEANLILHAVSATDPMREHHTRSHNLYYNEFNHRDEFDGPEFKVVRAFSRDPNLKVFHEMSVFSLWSDTVPKRIEHDLRSYNPFEFPIFMNRGEPAAKELIVEPQDVMQLLEQIKRMQAPEQADIRERRRRDVPIAHATILSFPEAA